MGTHLISVLGTSFYKPVFYDKKEKRDKYVQSAMIRRFYKGQADFRFSVLLTESARTSNWDNRKIAERDIQVSSRWEDDIQVKAGETNIGLKKLLDKEYPDLCVNEVNIPDGRTPKEILEIFESIYKEIK